jgi:hypothetical protein
LLLLLFIIIQHEDAALCITAMAAEASLEQLPPPRK